MYVFVFRYNKRNFGHFLGMKKATLVHRLAEGQKLWRLGLQDDGWEPYFCPISVSRFSVATI